PVDAVVLDVKAPPPPPPAATALALPARFPRIPMFALSTFRSDDGALLVSCHAAGFAGILVDGVDNAVAGECVAARTAQMARREAARRVAGATPQELAQVGPRGVLLRFLRGRTRSRI